MLFTEAPLEFRVAFCILLLTLMFWSELKEAVAEQGARAA